MVGLPAAGGSGSGGSGRAYSGTSFGVYWNKQNQQAPEPPKVAPAVKSPIAKQTPNTPPQLSFPQGQYGITVPYFIGRVLQASPNVLWYGNLRKETIQVQSLGNDGTIFYTNETAIVSDIQLGLGLGPGVKLVSIREGDSVIWTGDVGPDKATFDPGVTQGQFRGSTIFYGGEFDQTPEPIIVAGAAEEIPGYVGIAYVLLVGAQVDTTLERVSFEITRYPDYLALGSANLIGDDINPMTALYDVLVNTWGGCGFSSSIINTSSLVAAATVLKAEGNGLSFSTDEPLNPLSFIKAIEAQTDGICYINPETGLVEFTLIRPDSVDLDDPTLVSFGPSDITSAMRLKKDTWSGVTTRLRVKFTDRSNGYVARGALAQTISVVTTGGRARNELTKDYPMVCDGELANTLAARDLAALSVPRTAFSLETNRKGSECLPGQVVKVTWPNFLIDGTPMLVIKRRDHPININKCTLEVVQFAFPPNNALYPPPEEGTFTPTDGSPIAPSEVFIIDAPFLPAQQRVGTGNFSGIQQPNDANISVPFVQAKPANFLQLTYRGYNDRGPDGSLIRVINAAGYQTTASLQGAIGQFDGIANGIIPSIILDNITNSFWYGGNASYIRAAIGTWIFIDDEIFFFESVNIISATSVELVNVHRAMVDTAPQAHADNASVWAMVQPFSQIYYQLYTPGDPAPEWKFTGIRLSDNRESALGDALVYDDWTPTGRYNRPLRPHNTKIDGATRSATPLALVRGNPATVTWATRDRYALSLALTLDAAQTGEINGSDYQRHRVYIKDSADAVHDCGVTAEVTPSLNTLDITVPVGAAVGAGVLWVEAETDLGTSTRFKDELPITLS